MKRSIVLALFIGFCLSSLGLADMIQQVWLNSDWVDDAEGVAQLHEDRRPGMDLDPAPDQENVLTESWWDEGSSGLGNDYTANLWGWVTIPENIDLPDNQQDRDMIARELLVKFQMASNHPMVDLCKAYEKFA